MSLAPEVEARIDAMKEAERMFEANMTDVERMLVRHHGWSFDSIKNLRSAAEVLAAKKRQS